jgi:hypothetical protein
LLLLPGTGWAQNPETQEQETATTVPELAHVPSGQALVTYVDGELTIRSNNAPLGDILRAVCEKTNAVLDDAALLADGRRILTVLRPGLPRNVLSSLLSDEHLDFVIVAAEDDPNALGRIMLFPSPKDSSPRDQAAEVAQNGTTHPQSSRPDVSRAASVVTNTGPPQMKELLAQAKAEIANFTDLDPETMRQLYAQIQAAEVAGTDPSQTNTQASSGAPENAVGRPRHRRR